MMGEAYPILTEHRERRNRRREYTNQPPWVFDRGRLLPHSPIGLRAALADTIRGARLSRRERDVVTLLVVGVLRYGERPRRRDIAARLSISTRTVSRLLARARPKLCVLSLAWWDWQ
jgi:DNA-directed RNA polymerase specialized sigma24 family protein